MAGIKITATGNAGVYIESAAGNLYIDSFFHPVPDVGGRPVLQGRDASPASLILVTHNHYDHLHPEETRDAALATGARVLGPERVIKVMRKHLPEEQLLVLEPNERRQPPATHTIAIGNIHITSFRTYHGHGHNSYLLDLGGIRILHDGDNEHLEPYDLAALGRVDVLLLCPWADSGSGRFLQDLTPGRWLLIHLTDEEIDQHRAGAFLPALMKPVPEGVVALRGGESMEI